MMREPSMLVRETAAEQLEERQSGWAYSKPVVILDLIWNLAFVGVSLVVLCISVDEKPNTPLRVWICGYCLQCIVHTICVSSEYQRRYQQYQRYNHQYRQQQQQQQQPQSNVPAVAHGSYRTFQSGGESIGDNPPDDEETGGSNTRFSSYVILICLLHFLGGDVREITREQQENCNNLLGQQWIHINL
jgi:hypothetical protein